VPDHLPRPVRLGRRTFLQGSTWLLAGSCLTLSQVDQAFAADPPADGARLALLTDVHYADKPAAGSRHYRDALPRVARAITQFGTDKTQILIELGDLVDAAPTAETELAWLKTINAELRKSSAQRYYVLGNHCVDTLTKAEFLAAVEQPASHLAFDVGAWRCVVLDACFRSDSVAYGRKNFQWNDSFLPQKQLEWLQAELAASDRPTLVCLHQRLDLPGDYSVKNAAQVREVLERSGRVRAVLQGHYHQNDHREIAGIHYCTLAAVVEGAGPERNAFATLDLLPDGALRLTGHAQQSSYDWPPPAPRGA
jgi:alkaline phosphatase